MMQEEKRKGRRKGETDGGKERGDGCVGDGWPAGGMGGGEGCPRWWVEGKEGGERRSERGGGRGGQWGEVGDGGGWRGREEGEGLTLGQEEEERGGRESEKGWRPEMPAVVVAVVQGFTRLLP